MLSPKDKCCQYWPTEGSVTHGEITIEIKSDTLSEAISIRDFLVTFNQVLLPKPFNLLWTSLWVCLSLCQSVLLLQAFPEPQVRLVSTASEDSMKLRYQVADLP